MPQPRSAAFDAQLNSADRIVSDRLEIDLPLYRTNLAPRPSLGAGSNLADWTGGPGTAVTLDPTYSYVGSGSLKVTVTGATTPAGLDADYLTGVTWAGDTIAGSVMIRVATQLSASMGCYWAFLDATGAIVALGPTTLYGGAPTNGWMQLGSVAVVPSGTVTAVLIVQPGTPVGGATDVFWMDGYLVERAATLGTYFDGDVDATANRFANPTITGTLHDFAAGPGVSLTVDRGWSPDGVGGRSVALIPTTGSTDTFVALDGDANTLLHGFAPGQQYTVSATVNVPARLATTNTRAASIVVQTSDGTTTTTFQSAAGPVAGGTTRLSLTVTIPSTAKWAWVRLYHGGAAGDGIVRWGDVRITTGTDGAWARSRTSWLGVRQASTSRVNVAPYMDLTAALVSASSDRQVTTDLPDDVSLVTGYPAATVTLVLAGPLAPSELNNERHAFWLFNPHNRQSPVYGLDLTGAAVRYWAGLDTGQAWTGNPADPELLPQFTGTIDTVVVDNAAQQVTITCIDPRDTLRGGVRLPSFAYQELPAAAAANGFGNNPGLLASWCIDYMLRASGIHTGPPPRDRCMAYMSGNGSAWPEVYGYDPGQAYGMVVQQDTVAFTDGASGRFPYGVPSDYLDNTIAGPWHTQCVPSPEAHWTPSAGGSVAMTTGGGFFVEGDIYVVSDTPAFEVAAYTPGVAIRDRASTSFQEVFFDISANPAQAVVSVAVSKNNSTVVSKATPITFSTDTWHHIAIQWQWTAAGSVQVTVWLDYGPPTVSTQTGFSTTAGVYGTSVDLGFHGCYVDSMQVTAETAAVPAPLFVPQAYIDPSLNALIATVDVAGADPWATVQDLAEAELGYAGFDETGFFRFLNRYSIAGAPPARASDATVDLTGFTSQAQRSAVVTHVIAPTSAWNVSGLVDAWASDTAIKVGRYSTWQQTLALTDPALAPLAQNGTRSTTAHVVGTTEWRASKTGAGNTEVSAGITVTVQSLSPLSIQLTIVNTNPFDVWMVSPTTRTDVAAGSPFLYVGGATLTAATSSPIADSQWPPAAQGGAASNPAGDVALTLNANPWRQDAVSIQQLTDDLLAMLYKPRHQWQNVTTVGDPAVQLGDRKHVTDTEVGLDDDAYVFGHTFTSSKTEWTSSLNLRALAEPGAWVMGVSGRSEMGVTTIV